MIRPIWVKVPTLIRPSIRAITLWPFILYKRGVERDAALIAHEHYHWHHALRLGVIPFYVAYVILAIKHRTGGRGHPFEKPAYELADRVREGRE